MHLMVFWFCTLLFQYVTPQTCSEGESCTPQCRSTTVVDAVVVGAGISGLSQVKRFLEDGLNVHALEQAPDLGGTWYWNAYPGARCDIESAFYHILDHNLRSNWTWQEKYAPQGKILEHVQEFARLYDLRRHVTFNTKVEQLIYDDASHHWTVATLAGDCWEAQFVVLGTGCLSAPYHPPMEGMEKFKGELYYSSTWPRTPVEFEGKRVGIVGTGSSGIQMIPLVAEQAAHLTVFQKTPQYVVPLGNVPKDPMEDLFDKQNFHELSESFFKEPLGVPIYQTNETFNQMGTEKYRNILQARWEKGGLPILGSSADIFFSQEASSYTEEFIREKIRSTVKNPQIAELLSPSYPYICKRPVFGTNYYETYNRENVHLHSLAEAPISEFTEHGIITADGMEHKLDILIMATGFDLFGAPFRMHIRGKGGQTLRQKWAEIQNTYLGIQTANFPNLFFVAQIGSPSVFSNIVASIYQHVQFVGDLVAYMRKNQKNSVEPSEKAEQDYSHHLQAIADASLFTKPGCNSFYLGSNIPGKPRHLNIFLGVNSYTEIINEVKNYEGFIFS